MSIPSLAQVEALSGDAASFKAGKALATPGKWVLLGADELSLWGDCQGSGSKPYQVTIDLGDLAFKCTCPSRKFPCKHCIGLMVLAASGQCPQSPPPERVSEWLGSRRQRTVQKAARAEAAPDPETTARRNSRMEKGLEELALWMHDRVRQGLADLQGKPSAFWETPARRLVDAQAPGVAAMLREVGAKVGIGPLWTAEVLAGLGRLQLLIDGFSRLEDLDPDLQTEIRTTMGVPISSDLVLQSGEVVADRWQVLGLVRENDGSLRQQRLWLRGRDSGRYALHLSFAPAQQALSVPWMPGDSFVGELAFYPGTLRVRALLKNQTGPVEPLGRMGGYADLNEALTARAKALAVCPWATRFPLALEKAWWVRSGTDWLVQDVNGHVLPTPPEFEAGLHLAAFAGPDPVRIFGEWRSSVFVPLSVEAGPFLGLSQGMEGTT